MLDSTLFATLLNSMASSTTNIAVQLVSVISGMFNASTFVYAVLALAILWGVIRWARGHFGI